MNFSLINVSIVINAGVNLSVLNYIIFLFKSWGKIINNYKYYLKKIKSKFTIKLSKKIKIKRDGFLPLTNDYSH